MGCKAKRVSTVAELDEALKATLAERGPRLLEVEIDSEVQELY
jgi:thiamine pyrophosphate-dependent acetolactate synthase large subunit-like protein